MKQQSINTAVKRLIIFTIIAVLGCSVAVYKVSRDADQDTKGANIASCERGNTVRAYLIIDAGRNAKQPVERQEAAIRNFGIVNCSKTASEGKEVLYPYKAQKAYIDKLAVQLHYPNWLLIPNIYDTRL